MRITIDTIDNAFIVEIQTKQADGWKLKWRQAITNLSHLYSVLAVELEAFDQLYKENLEHNRQAYPPVFVLPATREDVPAAAGAASAEPADALSETLYGDLK